MLPINVRCQAVDSTGQAYMIWPKRDGGIRYPRSYLEQQRYRRAPVQQGLVEEKLVFATNDHEQIQQAEPREEDAKTKLELYGPSSETLQRDEVETGTGELERNRADQAKSSLVLLDNPDLDACNFISLLSQKDQAGAEARECGNPIRSEQPRMSETTPSPRFQI